MKTTREKASTSAPKCAVGIDEITERITEISTLPAVALRVMEVAGDPESGAADLKAAVEADPSLCVRVLRCVNSAAFGLRQEVGDLNQAIAYLGFNQIRDLAITASVSDLFRAAGTVGCYQRAALWKHMVAVGIGARMVATRMKVGGYEQAFLSGLLHDIGIILLDQNLHEEFRRVINSLTGSASLCEIETKLLGWDHTILGYRVGKKWKLPDTVLVSIRHHHEPEKYSGPDENVVHSVAIANLVCSLQNLTSVGQDLVGLSRESLTALSLEKSDLKVLAEDLEPEMKLHSHLFELQG